MKASTIMQNNPMVGSATECLQATEKSRLISGLNWFRKVARDMMRNVTAMTTKWKPTTMCSMPFSG